MANLKHHPHLWLRDDAAASINKAEDDHGRFVINSAGRTVAEQNGLIARWNRGGAANRPPYLYAPAIPAETSTHVKNGGVAIDLTDWRRFAKVARQYGWSHPYPVSDPVHFEFVGIQQTAGRAGFQDGSAELIEFQQKLIKMGHDLGPTGADGKYGPLTAKATLHEQISAEKNRYPGGQVLDDSIPGKATDAYLDWWLVGRHQVAAAKPATRNANVSDLQKLSFKKGLQLVARLNGYKGKIDNDFGPGSQAGLQTFLDRNYGGSLANWLRKKYGYKDRDDIWGPNMAAAAARAQHANWLAFHKTVK